MRFESIHEYLSCTHLNLLALAIIITVTTVVSTIENTTTITVTTLITAIVFWQRR